MQLNNKKVIIDAVSGNIINEKSGDKAILVGVYPYEDSNYSDKLQLVLNRENDTAINIDFPYSGYDMQLFVADFTGDKRDDIMVRGSYGGSGGFEIGVIYKYENNKLIEIFNQEKFAQNNSCSASYKDNYRAVINCGKKKYLIDLSSKSKDYLNHIYDENKKVKPSVELSVDSPNGIFPIKQVFNDYYDLLIQQRVVGIANFDTLGIIQTLGDLTNNNFNTIYKALLSFPYEEVEKNINAKKEAVREKKYSMEGSKIIKSSMFNTNQIYYENNIYIQRDNLDLVVNSIKEEGNILYIDGYLMNLKSYSINKVNNFRLELIDNKGRVFAKKTFDNIDIGQGIKSSEGKRISLSFVDNEYNLFDRDINNLTWNLAYDARS